MLLTAEDKDKLLLSVAAMVAQKRRDRGLKLNFPEAVALLSDAMLEDARDGRSVEETQNRATTILSRGDVMEGVAEMITIVQVHATFPDGARLVTVRNPIR